MSIQIKNAFNNCLLVHNQKVSNLEDYYQDSTEISTGIPENTDVYQSQRAWTLTVGYHLHLMMLLSDVKDICLDINSKLLQIFTSSFPDHIIQVRESKDTCYDTKLL